MQPTEPLEPLEPVEPVGPDQPSQHAYSVGRASDNEPPSSDNWSVWRRESFVYLIFGVIEVLILIRFFFKLLAANPSAGFSSFIYNITAPLVAPFEGVFPSPTRNSSEVELASLLAIVVYALLTWVIIRLIDLSRRRPPYAA
jgi:uncharacterized protein YggT (Ycf19 family)